MPQVQIDDLVFNAAQRRASEEGYSDVEEFVNDILVRNLTADSFEADRVFTPERLDELQSISAKIRSGGKTYTMAEVEAHFQNRRKTWLANHGI